jgi:hypothetical protein
MSGISFLGKPLAVLAVVLLFHGQSSLSHLHKSGLVLRALLETAAYSTYERKSGYASHAHT